MLDAETNNTEDLALWYGSLMRTLLTLFESIASGVSWDEVVRPLFGEVSVFAGVAFCVYVFFAWSSLMNVVTGLLVEKASHIARDERDHVLAHRISSILFQRRSGSGAGSGLE